MVQFGFLSAYSLFDLYAFQKGDASGHHKVESMAKITIFTYHVGGRRHIAFLQSACRLVCPSLGDAGKLRNLRQRQNLDTQGAEIMKSF